MIKHLLLPFALLSFIGNGFSQTCASPLSVSCGQTVSGTTLGETNNFENYGLNCSGSAGAKEGNDVVYEIVPSSSGQLTIDISGFSGGMRVAAFSSCMDDSSSCMAVSSGLPLIGNSIDITVTQGTTYYILVDGTNADDSSAFNLEVTCDQTTGMEETLADEISLYPNPATETVFINGVNLRNTAFEVIDVSGKLVNNVSLNQSSVDISMLNKGVYFIRFKRNEEIAIKKFIIN